jgi:hypothetical protein
MQIHPERSGGFAGLRLAHDIDSTALSPEQEAELNNLIEQSHLFELPPVLRAEHPGADRFQYKLRVKRDSQEHSVELDEAAMPPNLRSLINWVMARKRKA